jgi:glutaconate CoA-transferase, subunit B
MEIAGWANRCYVMTPHQKRRFPEKCDFVTSAGFLGGRKEREATGVCGGGTQCVVTDLGLMEPDANGELVLTGLHDCCYVEHARANTGWDLKVAPNLRHTDPPSEKELKILREDLDPLGTYR